MNISSCLLVSAAWVVFLFIFIYVRALKLPANDLSEGSYLGKKRMYGEIYLVEVSVSLAC